MQYNDADAAIWMVIYGVPAVWTGIAALFPGLLANRALRSLLVLCLVLAVSLTVLLWPSAEGFWRVEVWWADEAAREAMGVMVVVCVLAAVTWNGLSGCSRRR